MLATRRLVLLLLVALFAQVGVTLPAAAQTPPARTPEPTAPGKVHRLTLRNGSQLIGRVLSVDSDSVRFESDLGVTMIARANIVAFVEEQPGYVQQGRYFFPNPNETRLVFAPTGRMLKRGEGYFMDFWIFFPSVAYGVTDRITLGGGISILPGVEFRDQLLFFTPKVGVVMGDRFNVAVGALALTLPEVFEGEGRTSAGILYAAGTGGSSDHSVTAGIGYGYVNDRLADAPTLMVGGETRVAPRLSLVTENYFFSGGSGMLSGGFRFMGRDISVDLSFMRPMDGDGGESFWFPMLGFMWKW